MKKSEILETIKSRHHLHTVLLENAIDKNLDSIVEESWGEFKCTLSLLLEFGIIEEEDWNREFTKYWRLKNNSY